MTHVGGVKGKCMHFSQEIWSCFRSSDGLQADLAVMSSLLSTTILSDKKILYHSNHAKTSEKERQQ